MGENERPRVKAECDAQCTWWPNRDSGPLPPWTRNVPPISRSAAGISPRNNDLGGAEIMERDRIQGAGNAFVMATAAMAAAGRSLTQDSWTTPSVVDWAMETGDPMAGK